MKSKSKASCSMDLSTMSAASMVSELSVVSSMAAGNDMNTSSGINSEINDDNDDSIGASKSTRKSPRLTASKSVSSKMSAKASTSTPGSANCSSVNTSASKNTINNGNALLDSILSLVENSTSDISNLNASTISINSNASRNSRRDTADPDTIKQIMQSIEKDIPGIFNGDNLSIAPSVVESTTPKSRASTRSKKSSASKRNVTNSSSHHQQQTIDAPVSPLTPCSAISNRNTSSKKSSGKKSDKKSREEDRRLTVDANDLKLFIDELENEDKIDHGKNPRRFTADANDLAELLANMDEDARKEARESLASLISLNISDLNSTHRDSVATVELIMNVDNIIKSADTAEPYDDATCHSLNSFVSNISNLSFNSDAFKFEAESQIDPRRTTVDSIDLKNLMSNIDNSSFHDDTNHTGNESIKTLDLIDTVQSTLKNIESENINIDQSEFDESASYSSPGVRRSRRLSRESPAVLSPSLILNASLMSTGLKSCLSGRKSTRKSVVFGSPDVVEFTRDSKTDSFTPMSRHQAKVMFPLVQNDPIQEEDDDELTSENSRILDEWDRLTSTSGGSDSEDDSSRVSTPQSSPSSSPAVSIKSQSSSVSKSSPKSRRRRKSMLQPVILDEMAQVSQEISHHSEVTETVNLPETLGELLEAVIPTQQEMNLNMLVVVDESTAAVEDVTEALETDLHSLIDKIGCSTYINNSVYESENNSDSSKQSSSFNVTRHSVSSKASSDNSLGGLLGINADEISLDNSTNNSKAIESVSAESSFEFTKKFNTSLDRPRNSYEPMLSECSDASIMSPIAGDDEVSFRINKSMEDETRRFSLISNIDIAPANDVSKNDINEDGITIQLEPNLASVLDNIGKYPVCDDDMSKDQVVHINDQGKETNTSFDVEDDITEDLACDLNTMLADFENELANNKELADNSQNLSYHSEVATIVDEIHKNQSTPPLLARLRNLNENARKSTLSHCKTPLGTGSRLSVGLKRNSMAKSVIKYLNVEDENANKRNKINEKQDRSDDIKPTELTEPKTFSSLIKNISESFKVSDNDRSLISMFSEGIELFGKDYAVELNLKEILKEVLNGAIIESNIEANSNDHLDEQWKQISGKMDPNSVTEFFKEYNDNELLKKIGNRCSLNVNGKYKIWESKLLEISSDLVVQQAESLKEALEKERAQKLSLESQLQEFKEAFAPFDKNGAYEELLDIQTKIRQVRQSLEKSKDRETIEIGEEITDLLKQKQELSLNGLTYTNHSCPESNSNSNSNSNLTELEKAITLENLKLTVDSINKMNWCILTDFTSKNISYSVILSENLQIHIQFMLSCSNNNEIIVSKTNVSFSYTEIEANPGDLEISKDFLNNVLNNEVYGILSDKKLENIKSVASIKALMLTISGHISQFRRENSNRFN